MGHDGDVEEVFDVGDADCDGTGDDGEDEEFGDRGIGEAGC